CFLRRVGAILVLWVASLPRLWSPRMTHPLSRRQFLAAAGAAALTASSYGRVLGASERLALGIIGTGNRGRSLMRSFRQDKDVEFVSVCDVYTPYLELGAKEAGGKAKQLGDYRRVLDDKDIKGVVIATPDHWHARQLLDSLKAEKDVYLEKPMSLTVEQGARM